MAAVYGVDTSKATVVIDVGGGSVEITRGVGQEVQFARSFKLGVIRLTERFVTSDPLSGRDERKMVAPHHRSGRPVRAAYRRRRASTASSARRARFCRSARSRRQSTAAACRPRRATCASRPRAFAGCARQVTDLTLEQRLQLPGLDPRRADLTVAGAVLLDTLLRQLNADEITLCDLALREGLVLDYIHRHRSRHRARRSLSRRAAALDHRAGRALQLGSGTCPPGEPPGAGAVRPDDDAARPGRSRTRVAGIRRRCCTTSATTSATASTIAIRIT